MAPDRGLFGIQSKIQHQALERMKMGYMKYGRYDPRRDKRNLFQEIKEELLDARNYLDMLYWRLEILEEKTKNVTP